ncbi:hypothetical protein ACP6PL_21395 [Dapis sp. BLCC M126]
MTVSSSTIQLKEFILHNTRSPGSAIQAAPMNARNKVLDMTISQPDYQIQ